MKNPELAEKLEQSKLVREQAALPLQETIEVTTKEDTKESNRQGLMDFFNENSFNGRPSNDKSRHGQPYQKEQLESMTSSQLIELWYVLLRERNVLLTEQHFAWQRDIEYYSDEDAVRNISISMDNIKKQLKVINDRVNMIRRKDERRRTMRITTLYDTSEYGHEIELDKNATPAYFDSEKGYAVPAGYPLNQDVHGIKLYQSQDVEQPFEANTWEGGDYDKLALKEDKRLQEQFFWTKVQNLWNYYVEQQEEMLDPDEFKLRKEQDYYPVEAPEWWRERYSHPNMWKYGIWPQHSTMALDEHMRPKGMRHVHMMDQQELALEVQPKNAG